MKNCLVAQSGGPTTVINGSIVGVLQGNQLHKTYDVVYGGLNGMEGILEKKIVNLSKLTNEQIERLKNTPSSALGACRYKLQDYKLNEENYIKFFRILDEYEIDTFFYIGGNDSMDTVHKMSQYAEINNIKKNVIGIPKTIDNDLNCTDHAPGYASTGKFIVTIARETYLDSNVYPQKGVFIMETMGRDTGWLAASSALAQIGEKSVVDFVYLPESPISKNSFLTQIKERYAEQGSVCIVASEGIKDNKGNYLFNVDTGCNHDLFAHPQLGGVGQTLKSWIEDAGITNRIKVLELGITQRCAMHAVSQVDLEEAILVGRDAIIYGQKDYTGIMVALKRVQEHPYQIVTEPVDVSKVCNKVKYFPKEWITNHNQITEEGKKYMAPLIDYRTEDNDYLTKTELIK